MPEIPMTSFVDFVLANGPARLTRVRNVKRQMEEGYSPATDFYKGVREGIVDLHEGGLPQSYLDQVVRWAHAKKQAHYSEIVAGYKKFLRRKNVVSFKTRSASWTFRTLTVHANPDLGLKIDGSSHLVKLYFKSEKLSQRRVEVVLHLMRRGLASRRVALLDTRRGRLYSPSARRADMDAFLSGEAAAFIEMWRGID